MAELPDFLAAHDADVQRLGIPDRTDRIYAYYYLGLRQSEPLKIPKATVLLKKRKLYCAGTKTPQSRRWIPIPAVIMPMVERLLDETPGDNLFADDWAPSTINTQLRRWGVASGIGPIIPNDLRRSYATMLADAGVEEALCLRYMGHKSSDMIRAVYRKITERQNAAALARIDALSTSVDSWHDSASKRGKPGKLIAL